MGARKKGSRRSTDPYSFFAPGFDSPKFKAHQNNKLLPYWYRYRIVISGNALAVGLQTQRLIPALHAHNFFL